MCEVFVKADPALYAFRARSLRLHGAVTSIRLENQFWQVLEEIAARDQMTTNQLITKLYDEIVACRCRSSRLARSGRRRRCIRADWSPAPLPATSRRTPWHCPTPHPAP